MTIDAWSPAQYNRFAAERERPFWDLVAHLDASGAPRVVDLGCGDGRLTQALGRRLGASSIHGIDASPSMLERAARYGDATTSFAQGDLATWRDENVDIIVANASLQWVDDHAAVLTRWMESLRPGGQLAVQVPANGNHPSHLVSGELAAEILGEDDHVAVNVLRPEDYAEILAALGTSVDVTLRVYLHELASSEELVEWMKGTALTRFRERLSAEDYDALVAEYRARLLDRVGRRSPYLFTFNRILMYVRA